MTIEEKTMEQQFEEFHKKNPYILKMLIKISKELKNKHGVRKASIAWVFERLRWLYLTNQQEGFFRVGNNHKPYYARLIMRKEPSLAGFFNLNQQWATNRPPRKKKVDISKIEVPVPKIGFWEKVGAFLRTEIW